MGITIKDVEHVAQLSRLDLSDEEKEGFAEQLNTMLQYARKLDELDTTNVKPTSHTNPIVNALREDVVRPSLPFELIMLNAPEEEDGQFKVPAILE